MPVLSQRPVVVLLGLALAASACADSQSTSNDIPTALARGTWGGEGVGVIVSDTLTHVHIGCTKGDFRGRTELDAAGRFNVSGSYVLRAFPVQLGPPLPAQFSGVVRGTTLTMSVAVNDTVERKLVVLGPVTITLGREPRLGSCPICVSPMPSR
jgi:hypothetical protein